MCKHRGDRRSLQVSSRGTSWSILCALALLNTPYPRWRTAARPASLRAGSAERRGGNQTGSQGCTDQIPHLLGAGLRGKPPCRGVGIAFPAERSDAPKAVMRNQGLPANNWMNLCPTAPVAPSTDRYGIHLKPPPFALDRPCRSPVELFMNRPHPGIHVIVGRVPA